MDIQNIPTTEIIPYPKNVKKHPPSQIQDLMTSIQTFGFTQPIVIDEKNEVLVGHGRLLAALQLQMKTVPCVVLVNLTKKQKKELRIADNKLNESPWDALALQSDIAEFAILEPMWNGIVLGFTTAEVDALLKLGEHVDEAPIEAPESFDDISDDNKETRPKKFSIVLDNETYEKFIGQLTEVQDKLGFDNSAELILYLVRKAYDKA